MKHPCREFRIRSIAVASKEAERDEGLDRHLAACAACRTFLERVGRHIATFAELGRLTAPHDLDGRAVAATQAGFRQDRAIRALQGLEPHVMPDKLDRRMWPDDAKAPKALDRLVTRELEDPAQALTRRFAGRLERLRAPRELDVVVRHRSIGRGARLTRLRSFPPFVLFAAAALVLALGFGGTLLLQKRVEAAPGPRIVIQRVDSLDQMSPELQQAFAGIGGGAADPHLPREKM